MKIENSIAFVTGANRGFGRALVNELLARGAKKVYAGMRDPSGYVAPEGVVPVRIDVTDEVSVAEAARIAIDAQILINNAGVSFGIDFLADDAVEKTRQTFETNFYGPIHTSRAFAPILKRNGGGAILNVLSVMSWIASEASGPYAASKSAAWGFTNALRLQLRAQGTQVLGLHVGFMDTDMVKRLPYAKVRPEDVAADTLDALEAGRNEVLGDATTYAVKAGLSAKPGIYLSAPAL